MNKPKFEIRQRVFHVTPESDCGVVLDCRYSIRSKTWTYIVSFGHTYERAEYYEDELSVNKCYADSKN